MFVRVNGRPQPLHTRAAVMNSALRTSCRLPSGHPEGFLEAFANVYTAAYEDMIARASGCRIDRVKAVYPNVDDGLDGMGFISQCVASAQANGAWQYFPPPGEVVPQEKELPMIEEVRNPAGSAAPGESSPPASESTVRGMLQGAIQKVMAEIDHHEHAAKHHMQLAEDLRKELQEGFRVVKQEARASAKAARAETTDGLGTSVEPTAPEEAAKSPRAEAKKKAGGRKPKK